MYYTDAALIFGYSTRKETDTHIYWTSSVKKPRVENNKFFYQHTNDCGVTYDKVKKSIKFINFINVINLSLLQRYRENRYCCHTCESGYPEVFDFK